MTAAMEPLPVPVREIADGEAEEEGRSPVWAVVRLVSLDSETFLRRIRVRTQDTLIALDHVMDPRNLGAIARSAAFFGCREIVVAERRQVLLTRASVATAQGGFALTDLVTVTNLGRILDELKECGYWVIGAAMDGESLGKSKPTFEKRVLIFGSEDSGLSPNIQKRCDLVAGIGAKTGLDSLNVSVAAGIFLYEFCGRTS